MSDFDEAISKSLKKIQKAREKAEERKKTTQTKNKLVKDVKKSESLKPLSKTQRQIIYRATVKADLNDKQRKVIVSAENKIARASRNYKSKPAKDTKQEKQRKILSNNGLTVIERAKQIYVDAGGVIAKRDKNRRIIVAGKVGSITWENAVKEAGKEAKGQLDKLKQ